MAIQTPIQGPASPPPPPPPLSGFSAQSTPLPTPMSRRGLWIALGAAAATFIGALLPWATGPLGISVSGTSGDGILAIILSVPMAAFAWLMVSRRWATVATMVVSILTIALMLFEVVHISSTTFASLGFGVIVCLAGGVAGLVGGILGRSDLS